LLGFFSGWENRKDPIYFGDLEQNLYPFVSTDDSKFSFATLCVRLVGHDGAKASRIKVGHLDQVKNRVSGAILPNGGLEVEKGSPA
jgi:hypothetical protein